MQQILPAHVYSGCGEHVLCSVARLAFMAAGGWVVGGGQWVADKMDNLADLHTKYWSLDRTRYLSGVHYLRSIDIYQLLVAPRSQWMTSCSRSFTTC